MSSSIWDIIEDRKYKKTEPMIVGKKVRIPGTVVVLDKGDRIYHDSENNRIIIEPAISSHIERNEDNT